MSGLTVNHCRKLNFVVLDIEYFEDQVVKVLGVSQVGKTGIFFPKVSNQLFNLLCVQNIFIELVRVVKDRTG